MGMSWIKCRDQSSRSFRCGITTADNGSSGQFNLDDPNIKLKLLNEPLKSFVTVPISSPSILTISRDEENVAGE